MTKLNKQQLKNLRKQVASIPHWYHQIKLAPGLITPGINNSSDVLRLLKLPKDCHGLRALDLGTRDDFFAFELEKRGAHLIALDYVPKETTDFDLAKRVLNSKKVKDVRDNIYNLSTRKFGKFDIVLFLGLLYHLPDPLRAPRLIREVSTYLMFIEKIIKKTINDNRLIVKCTVDTPGQTKQIMDMAVGINNPKSW